MKRIGKWAAVVDSTYTQTCATCPVVIKKGDICYYDWGVVTCRHCSPEAAEEYKAAKHDLPPVIGSSRPWNEVDLHEEQKVW